MVPFTLLLFVFSLIFFSLLERRVCHPFAGGIPTSGFVAVLLRLGSCTACLSPLISPGYLPSPQRLSSCSFFPTKSFWQCATRCVFERLMVFQGGWISHLALYHVASNRKVHRKDNSNICKRGPDEVILF